MKALSNKINLYISNNKIRIPTKHIFLEDDFLNMTDKEKSKYEEENNCSLSEMGVIELDFDNLSSSKVELGYKAKINTLDKFPFDLKNRIFSLLNDKFDMTQHQKDAFDSLFNKSIKDSTLYHYDLHDHEFIEHNEIFDRIYDRIVFLCADSEDELPLLSKLYNFDEFEEWLNILEKQIDNLDEDKDVWDYIKEVDFYKDEAKEYLINHLSKCDHSIFQKNMFKLFTGSSFKIDLENLNDYPLEFCKVFYEVEENLEDFERYIKQLERLQYTYNIKIKDTQLLNDDVSLTELISRNTHIMKKDIKEILINDNHKISIFNLEDPYSDYDYYQSHILNSEAFEGYILKKISSYSTFDSFPRNISNYSIDDKEILKELGFDKKLDVNISFNTSLVYDNNYKLVSSYKHNNKEISDKIINLFHNDKKYNNINELESDVGKLVSIKLPDIFNEFRPFNHKHLNHLETCYIKFEDYIKMCCRIAYSDTDARKMKVYDKNLNELDINSGKIFVKYLDKIGFNVKFDINSNDYKILQMNYTDSKLDLDKLNVSININDDSISADKCADSTFATDNIILKTNDGELIDISDHAFLYESVSKSLISKFSNSQKHNISCENVNNILSKYENDVPTNKRTTKFKL